MQEEIFGPVLVTTTFRTPDEAAKLANDTRYGLAASIWSENVNLCLGLAPKIKAGVIWVNGTNMFDASAGFGGCGKAVLEEKVVGKVLRPTPNPAPRLSKIRAYCWTLRYKRWDSWLRPYCKALYRGQTIPPR